MKLCPFLILPVLVSTLASILIPIKSATVLARVAIFLLSICIFSQASGHDKIDVITLNNGDKITGEFKSLYGGILELNTDALGLLKIEWEHVSRIESEFQYDIRLSNGTRYLATIQDSDVPGQLNLTSYVGDYNIQMLDVVEVRPVAESFADRIDIYLSAGYSYTKASSVAQTSFNTQISYEDERVSNSLSARIVNTNTNDEVTSSTKLDLSRSVWTDRSKLFKTYYARYEENDELALKGRYTLGGGFGRYFVDNQKLRWTGSIGIQALTEKSTDGANLDSIEGFLSTKLSVWHFDTPELDFEYSVNIYPSFTESGRVRGDTDLRLRWELIEDVYWDLTAFGTYDNEAESDSEFDYGITTGLGWTY